MMMEEQGYRSNPDFQVAGFLGIYAELGKIHKIY
jgi:hypothetical protein